RAACTESTDSRRSRFGPSRPYLATRIESLQCATCSRTRSALCIRIAFRARGHDAGFAALSHTLQAIAATRPPIRHAGPERDRRRNGRPGALSLQDRKSTRLNSSHVAISYAVFCLKKKIKYK